MASNTSRQWAYLFLMLAVLFGGIVRFAPAMLANGPVNDGGMFATMIDDLRANGMRLPAETSYNQLGIPFAYPPLSLYAGALLSGLGLPVMGVVRWLPAIVSTLAIVAFYWAAAQILASSGKAALATVAYALMPRTFSWYVMGGGLSRSFGILFFILTCGAVWLLFTRPGRKWLAISILCGAAAVLSHPETALHTFAACGLIWLFRGRTRAGVRDAAAVALGVLLLTSPWWGTVLMKDGLAPFASALHTGQHSAFFWLPWLTMDVAEERFVTLLTVLGLLGLAVKVLKREWFLPAWLLFPFMVEPRSAVAVAALPLAMLAGVGLADFVLPDLAALISGASAKEQEWTASVGRSPALRWILAYVVLSGVTGTFAYDLALSNYTVPATSRAAMEWAQANTPANARFVVLTGHTDPFSDPSAEWFPTFTGRTSINTIQGQEWTLGSGFTPFLNDISALQTCQNSGTACVEDWASRHHLAFDYVYLEKPGKAVAEPSGLLLFQLQQNPAYSLVFQNAGVVIFSRK